MAVRTDPDEPGEYFTIDLVLYVGPTYCLRRQWWPMDNTEDAALARAAPIAEYLGVELRDVSGMTMKAEGGISTALRPHE